MIISVVVPIYNGEKYLNRCINSIVSSSYKNLQIVLVNDGSTDNSLDICKTWETRDERIMVLNKINSGVSAARNLGMSHCYGEFISFVDADDFICETMYATAIKHIDENVDMIGFYPFFCNEEGRVLEKMSWAKNSFEVAGQDALGKYMYPKYPFSVWSKIFRSKYIINKDTTLQIKFDETKSSMEDFLFVCTYLSRCKGIVKQLLDSLYYYVIQKKSLSRQGITDKSIDVLNTIEDVFKLCDEAAITKAHLRYCEEALNLYRKYLSNNNKIKDTEKLFRKEFKRFLPEYVKSSKVSVKRKILSLSMLLAARTTTNCISCYQLKLEQRGKIL